MTSYVALLRGINVGGKNKVSMAELRGVLEKLGYTSVMTYINSGNVILKSEKDPDAIAREIEQAILANFALDSKLIRVHVLSYDELKAVVDNKPQGFGDEPTLYHSDAIFLIGFDVNEAMQVFDPREGIDKVWPGEGVIYSQRLSAERTKSRLGKIIGTKPYGSMTIRSWNTTTKLLGLLNKNNQDS